MPELPDITIYQESLERHFKGQSLKAIRVASPSLLKSVEPPLKEFEGKALRSVERIGKQLVLRFDRSHYLVIHLMIAGRLKLKKTSDKGARKGWSCRL